MIYRAYFNRKNEWPQVWAIDEGNQKSEINVVEFQCWVPVVTRVMPREEWDKVDRGTVPLAWLEADGKLIVENGIAKIVPEGV